MTRLMTLRGAFSFVAFAMLLAASGCGRPSATVTGKVTYLSKNLKGGSVGFISTEGLPGGTTTIKEDGTYEIQNLPAGKYKIIVDTESLLPKAGGTGYGKSASLVPDDAKKTMGPPPGANIPDGYKPMTIADVEAKQKENAKRYMKIPLNYGNIEETTLEYTVVGGPQTHDIELK